jgi:hypothetical protein
VKNVLENHSELLDMGKGEATTQALEKVLIKDWNSPPDSLSTSLIDSMSKRIKVGIKAHG